MTVAQGKVSTSCVRKPCFVGICIDLLVQGKGEDTQRRLEVSEICGHVHQ